MNDASTVQEYLTNELKREIKNSFYRNLDAQNVLVNGKEQTLLITRDKGDEQIKKVKSMPDEVINLGDIITWNGVYYIVYKLDGDRRIQSKGRMYQCNAVLRWKNKDGIIVERHGKAEDATKYSEGTMGGNTLRIGEFQLKVIIRLDEESCLIQRDDRFILDAQEFIGTMLENGVLPKVYRVTRRNVVTGTFDVAGYVEITLVEDQFIAGSDDIENMIACSKRDLISNSTNDTANTGNVNNTEDIDNSDSSNVETSGDANGNVSEDGNSGIEDEGWL